MILRIGSVDLRGACGKPPLGSTVRCFYSLLFYSPIRVSGWELPWKVIVLVLLVDDVLNVPVGIVMSFPPPIGVVRRRLQINWIPPNIVPGVLAGFHARRCPHRLPRHGADDGFGLMWHSTHYSPLLMLRIGWDKSESWSHIAPFCRSTICLELWLCWCRQLEERLSQMICCALGCAPLIRRRSRRAAMGDVDSDRMRTGNASSHPEMASSGATMA